MYEEHPAFESPEKDSVKIWRYMDFTKFVSVLDRSALYFVRIDKFRENDPFEGSYPKSNIDLIKAGHGTISRARLISFGKLIKYLSKRVAINSWHINENESAAMWKLYLKSNEGIAVQSTFGRLKKSFTDKTRVIYIGRVKYINYERDSIDDTNIFFPLLHKRESFKHEQELRAVLGVLKQTKGKVTTTSIPKKFLTDHQLYVPIDLNTLIENIYLAPTCPNWIYTLVTSVTKKYGLDKQVIPSNLDAKPSTLR
jgi:hypothetical protein